MKFILLSLHTPTGGIVYVSLKQGRVRYIIQEMKLSTSMVFSCSQASEILLHSWNLVQQPKFAITAEIWRLKRAFGCNNIIDITITTYATTMNVEKLLLLITAFFNATAIYDSLREHQTSFLVSILIIFY